MRTTMKAKACWVATQTKAGWRLKISIGPKDYPVRGLLLGSEKDVQRACGDLGVVLVHMKNPAS